MEIPRTQHVREETEIRNRSKSVTKQGQKGSGTVEGKRDRSHYDVRCFAV